MPEKIITPLLLTAGIAAIAYGMLRENNFVFIAGIAITVAGYLLIRKHLRRSKSRQQDMDTSDTPAPSDEE